MMSTPLFEVVDAVNTTFKASTRLFEAVDAVNTTFWSCWCRQHPVSVYVDVSKWFKGGEGEFNTTAAAGWRYVASPYSIFRSLPLTVPPHHGEPKGEPKLPNYTHSIPKLAPRTFLRGLWATRRVTEVLQTHSVSPWAPRCPSVGHIAIFLVGKVEKIKIFSKPNKMFLEMYLHDLESGQRVFEALLVTLYAKTLVKPSKTDQTPSITLRILRFSS